MKRIEKRHLMDSWTDEQIAQWYEEHDPEDYIGQGEPVRLEPERAQWETISLKIREKDLERLKRVAEAHDIGYTTLLRQWVKEKLAAHFHLPLMMATVRRVAGQTEELPEIESIHYALQPERESIKLLIQFEGLAEPIEYPIHESEIECLEINPRPIMNLIREDLLQALEEAKVK